MRPDPREVKKIAIWIAPGVLASLFTALAVWWFAPSERERLEFPRGLFTPPTTAPAAGGEACKRTYARLYRRPELAVRIVFGYKDARPARFVGDRYERNLLVSYLVAPCPAHYHACGFRRDPEDADLFLKDITGPDGKPRRVKLRLMHSSAGPDDEENRRDPYQKWLSRQAQNAFFGGIRDVDVVFYNGHSRDGGGPDFTPPRLRADKHVNYWWYANTKPGLTTLLNVLEASETRARLLGLYSCVSTGLFSETLRQADEKLALVTSRRLLYYADALKSLLGTLSAVLGQWCESDFDAALQAESKGSSSLINFFR